MTVSELALLDAAGARAGDAAAVQAGATWAGLMERAAGHLARGVVGAAGGRGYGLKVALVVGKGNNGGDGWAAARRLEQEHGARCWVVAVDGVEVVASDEASANRAAWLRSGGRTTAGVGELDAALAWCDVAVDCLLGTGISGAPRGAVGQACAALLRAREGGTAVVACDIPSGVSSDDGSAPPGSVRADLTVTFGGLKRGLMLHPGADHAGRVVLGELGDGFVADGAGWSVLTAAGAAPPRLAVDADKRVRGVVLGIAGAVGSSGAAALVADGALRAGAGLVTMATPEPVRSELAARCDAGVMVHGLPADEGGAVDATAVTHTEGPSAASVLRADRVAAADVVVAGPGLGYGDGAASVVAHLRHYARRLVLDADALNVHREHPAALGDHAGELVLTPHVRELARIGGGEDGSQAWEQRVDRVPALARELDATIVAKGPGTLVAAPDGRVWVTPAGSAALGSGGTGDALAGILAAAVAGADDVPLALARAVWWHAAAGVCAGRDRGARATATDLLAALPVVLGDPAAAALGLDLPAAGGVTR
ncbi:MAG: NAD(P)H-hydrate dehydratase [Nitriliruptoraceae bacterium]